MLKRVSALYSNIYVVYIFKLYIYFYINPLMPKRYFFTSIKFLVFKKQMLQVAKMNFLTP